MPEQARQSFSTNMMPDWSDELDTVTRIARRKFAFAREVGDYTSLTLTLNPNPNPNPNPNLNPNQVGDYTSLVEGPGQEPVCAALYNPTLTPRRSLL